MKRYLIGLLGGLLMGSASALECRVVPVLNFNLTDQWMRIMPGQPTLSVSAREVRTRQPFEIRVFVTKPAVVKNRVRVDVRFSIIRPDGSTLFEQKEPQLGIDSEVKASGILLMPSLLRADFEPASPEGKYKIVATIYDRNSGQSAGGEAFVTYAKKMASDDVTFTNAELGDFVMNYYQKPAPEKLLGAFKAFLKDEPAARKKMGQRFNPLSMLAFFHFALQQNPQLYADFIALSPTLDKQHLLYLGLVLQSLPGMDKLKTDPALSEVLKRFPGNIYTFKTVENPVQQDILWSRFFADGTWAPIKMLVDSLHSGQETLSLEAFKKIEKPTLDERKKLFRGVTEVAANWSLTVNGRRHPLVFFYLEAMVRRNEIEDPVVAEKLRKMMNELQSGTPGKKGE